MPSWFCLRVIVARVVLVCTSAKLNVAGVPHTPGVLPTTVLRGSNDNKSNAFPPGTALRCWRRRIFFFLVRRLVAGFA